MYKSNAKRNGVASETITIQGVKKTRWRLKNLRLASAEKRLTVDSQFLYCVGFRNVYKFASFYKIDTKTGKIHSSLELDEKVNGGNKCFSSPVIEDGLAYLLFQPVFKDDRPKLYCIHVASMKVVYVVDIYQAMDIDLSEKPVDALKMWVRSSILLVRDSIYIGTGNGYVCSFNAKKGSLQWKISVDNNCSIGHLAYSEDFLYLESSDRDLYSVDISRRAVRWKFECQEEPKTYLNWRNLCPVIAGDKVYVFSNLKNIYAINRVTGELVWKYGLPSSKPCVDLVVANKNLIAGMSDLTARSLDRDSGEQQWCLALERSVSFPIIFKDKVLMSNGDYLCGIDTFSGEIEKYWKIPFAFNKIFDLFYIMSQLFRFVYRKSRKVGFSSISTPCVTQEGIFLTTEMGTDFSLFKLD